MAYLVQHHTPPSPNPTAFRSHSYTLATVSWPCASFSKESVDLEDNEAYFPVWITQMGCGILLRWQSNP